MRPKWSKFFGVLSTILTHLRLSPSFSLTTLLLLTLQTLIECCTLNFLIIYLCMKIGKNSFSFVWSFYATPWPCKRKVLYILQQKSLSKWHQSGPICLWRHCTHSAACYASQLLFSEFWTSSERNRKKLFFKRLSKVTPPPAPQPAALSAAVSILCISL